MQHEEEDFSFSSLLQKNRQQLLHALLQWRMWMVTAGIGAIIGMVYSWYVPVTYTARTSFVVEDAKSSGGSLMSALAGQFGFDNLGSLAGGGNGILSGDNVMELLKSRSLIKKTLLTAVDSNSKVNTSLADLYADTYGWKQKWEHSSKVGRVIYFPAGKTVFSRLEDSLLQRIIKRIEENELSISKPDKKLGFFEIQTTMRNEELSRLFCLRHLKTATDFYIETKTRRLLTNVNRLQAKADSLGYSLNRRTYSAADANRMLLDANPAYAAPEVSAEISSREKLMQGTIYAEIVKNLEISKTALIQETPTVQIVDRPELPLKTNNDLYWLLVALIGAAAGFAAGIVLLLLRKN